MHHRAFLALDESNPVFNLEYNHNPKRWESNLIPVDSPIRDMTRWSMEYKYYNPDYTKASEEIYNLPDDTGGIYVFYLKGLNLPFFENYILYVGKCSSTDSQYIKKRALEYQHDNRPLIKEMMSKWKKNLYYRFFPDTDNNRIKQTEIILIRSILPYYNEEIPDNLCVQPKVKAF